MLLFPEWAYGMFDGLYLMRALFSEITGKDDVSWGTWAAAMPDFLHKAADAFLHPGGWYLFVRIVTRATPCSASAGSSRLRPASRSQATAVSPDEPRCSALGGLAVACAPLVTWDLCGFRSTVLLSTARPSTRSTSSPGLGRVRAERIGRPGRRSSGSPPPSDATRHRPALQRLA